ncbi:hypothetical protein Pse7367_2370 [Thalassoporum mexicanum PCC 7367]|uniref:hypothetical protein n=1 Tax=Thalassoporum mexicanum TaxID=3457544 RepID=UPI00029F82C2|nr:hypothetical protein [Pseudanabaena sp. PCC 7367]AFY70631.1 hypothetical protein Pse7367_2370 [Pseudanabaena sp. PCC 7367]
MQIDTSFIERWTIANVIGVLLVNLWVILAFAISFVMFKNASSQTLLNATIAVAPPVMFIGAYILGRAQWQALKRILPTVKGWSWLTAAGFCLGAIVGFGIIFYRAIGSFYFEFIFYFELTMPFLILGAGVGIAQSFALKGKIKSAHLWIPTQTVLFGGRLLIDVWLYSANPNIVDINILFWVMRLVTATVYGVLSGLVLRSLIKTPPASS